MIVFNLPINPRGKGRPRFDPRTDRTYTDDETRAYEKTLATLARLQYKGPPLAGPLIAVVTFYMPVPPTSRRPFPFGPPDYDNLDKALWDALDGIAFANDAQIVTAVVRKRWVEKPNAEAGGAGSSGKAGRIEVRIGQTLDGENIVALHTVKELAVGARKATAEELKVLRQYEKEMEKLAEKKRAKAQSRDAGKATSPEAEA